jgi:hypothetical protein
LDTLLAHATAITDRLEALEQKISTASTASGTGSVGQVTRDSVGSDALGQEIVTTARVSTGVSTVPVVADVGNVPTVATQVVCDLQQPLQSQQPPPMPAGSSVLSWVDVARSQSSSGNGGFETVNRKKVPKNAVAGINVNINTGAEATANAQSDVKRRFKFLGENKIRSDASLKTAVKIVRKVVLHVDNLSDCCTDVDVKNFLSKNGIEVLSCFPAKSWLRESDTVSVKSFRVCIPVNDEQACTSPSLWPQGVIVREWVFKKTQHGSTS